MGLFRKKPNEEKMDRKPGLFTRLRQSIRNIDWKNPMHRWRLLFISLFALVVIGAGSYSAIALTSTNTFCGLCHEMSPENVTHQASAHSEVGCVDCHIGPGVVNTLVHKVEALKEVYYHIVGPPDPIVQTAAVPDKNCLQCHSENRLVTATGDLIVAHDEHIDEQISCITCHSGVAHAKVVERGMNYASDRDYWTTENADKLVSIEYMLPNMGTCIDCHEKVNNGERPWEDLAYSLPDSSHYENKGKKKDRTMTVNVTAAENTEENELAMQNIILQAIGKQTKDVKISMDCFTCHQEVGVPKHHDMKGWDQNHGDDAFKELDQCLDCHEDTKWMKEVPEQDVISLIESGAKSEDYKQSMTTVTKESRERAFCSTCHGNRPPSHGDSDKYLTSHANKAQTKEQKAECFVCHDNEKPIENEVSAPTDVYCEYCHRTGLKND